MNLFDGICGRVAPGMCRIAMDGSIAVKTRSGYRTCDSFVLDIGEDFFFVMPSNRVKPGDIIHFGGMPRCILSVGEDTFTAVNFEDATVETLIPEHHQFMGNTYLYAKIVSLIGRNGIKGKKGAGRMMRYMMLSGLLKGKENGGTGLLLPLMLAGGKKNCLDDLFEEDDENDKDGEEEA